MKDMGLPTEYTRMIEYMTSKEAARNLIALLNSFGTNLDGIFIPLNRCPKLLNPFST